VSKGLSGELSKGGGKFLNQFDYESSQLVTNCGVSKLERASTGRDRRRR